MQEHASGQGQSGDGLIGKTVAGYRIDRYIARGGMGVVYQGVQVSLDRPVAVKILYPHLADDPSFVERFQREARSEARLTHPNIVRVLDFGSENGAYFMIMDYIDGESLRERLARVSAEGLTLNTSTMMRIVEEVGSALTYAHGLGMVHRDVKPGNVLLGNDGHAYLADFGVVKILGEASMTVVGTVVGTPEYMAPEQGTGSSDIGPAADLYSLGILTYEMMVGRAPFKAPTPAGVLHMQLTQPPPPPSTVVPWFAPEVEDVIMRALSKDPSNRQASVEQFVNELRIATAGIRERATSRYAAQPTVIGDAATGAAAAAAAAGLAASSAMPPLPTAAPTVPPSAVPPASGATMPPSQSVAAASGAPPTQPPSAAGVAAAGMPAMPPADATGGGSGGSPPPPRGATNGNGDARKSSRRELWVVAVICLAVLGLAAYIFTRGDGDDSNAGGGGNATATLALAATATTAAEPTATQQATTAPVNTPAPVETATQAAIEPTATDAPSVEPTPTEAGPEATATVAPVAPTATTLAAAPPGYKSVILFASHRGEVHDSQIYVMNPDGSDEHQLTFSRGHSWGPRISHNGEMFFFSSVAPGEHTDHSATGGGTTGQGNHDIYVASPDGSNITKITFVPSWDNGWSWSPDDASITFTSDRDGNWEIYTMNPDGSNIVRLTNHDGNDGWPSWTPDGTRILFSSDRTGDWEIYSMNADGSGVRQLTDRPGTVDTYPYVSPDGTRIAFSSQVAASNEGEIYAMDLDGGNVTRLTSTAALNYAPSWAPDGSKIIFVSDRDGNDNIYIMDPDGRNQQRLTDDPGQDTTPSWGWIKESP